MHLLVCADVSVLVGGYFCDPRQLRLPSYSSPRALPMPTYKAEIWPVVFLVRGHS